MHKYAPKLVDALSFNFLASECQVQAQLQRENPLSSKQQQHLPPSTHTHSPRSLPLHRTAQNREMKRYKLHYVQPRDDGPQAVGKGSKNGGVPTGSTNDRCSASGKVAIEPPPSSSRTNSMASGGASAATAAAAMQSSGRRGGSKLRGKLKKHTNAISAAREFNRIGEAKKLERKDN